MGEARHLARSAEQFPTPLVAASVFNENIEGNNQGVIQGVQVGIGYLL